MMMMINGEEEWRVGSKGEQDLCDSSANTDGQAGSKRLRFLTIHD